MDALVHAKMDVQVIVQITAQVLAILDAKVLVERDAKIPSKEQLLQVVVAVGIPNLSVGIVEVILALGVELVL